MGKRKKGKNQWQMKLTAKLACRDSLYMQRQATKANDNRCVHITFLTCHLEHDPSSEF